MTAYTALFILFSSVMFSQTASAQATEQEAQLIVEQYMQALKNGDVTTVRSKLSKSQLREKNTTFKTSDYDRFLRNLYKNSRYEILNTEITGVDTAIVDVEVIYKKNDTTKFRLWLAEEDNILRIIGETNLIP
jgi:hypothetical protein